MITSFICSVIYQCFFLDALTAKRLTELAPKTLKERKEERKGERGREREGGKKERRKERRERGRGGGGKEGRKVECMDGR